MMHYTHRLSQAQIHRIVGWFVLVPVLIVAGVLFVVGKNENIFAEKYKITTVFSEGYGLKVGYPVMLLGLEVGRIAAIEFTDQNNALFTLKILKKYQDKIRADSKAVIGKSGGFLGEPQIEITAGKKSEPVVQAGGHIESDEPLNLMAEAKELLETVGKTLARVDVIAQEVQATIKTAQATLGNVQEASAGLPKLMDNFLETSATIKQTSKDVALEVPALAANVRKTLNRVGDVVEDVKSSTAKLPAMTENFKAASEDLKGLIHNDVPPLVSSVQGSVDDVNEILAGAKKTFPISVFAAKGRAARDEDNAAFLSAGLRSLRADELTK
jgi:phospholipid/cholesterol/gamma-HCH transport system substrate-binding protein